MGSVPLVGKPVLVVGLITFTFSTMLGWYYYGERCAVYLFGEKAILIYKIIWVAGIFAGSLAELKFIWNIADILNGLMSIPDIVAVLLLSGVIASETKKYAGKQFWLCFFNKNFCLQKRKNAKACRKAYDGARQNIRQKMVSAQHAQDHSQNAKKERGEEQGLLVF